MGGGAYSTVGSVAIDKGRLRRGRGVVATGSKKNKVRTNWHHQIVDPRHVEDLGQGKPPVSGFIFSENIKRFRATELFHVPKNTINDGRRW